MGGNYYIRAKNGILFQPPRVTTINNFFGSENVISTTEVILSSINIPPNTFENYDLVNVESRINKNNFSGVCAIRIRIGTGQTTSDTLVATFSATSGNNFIPIKRTLKITFSTTTTEVITPTQSVSYDDTYSGFTLSNVPIDWTKNNYISVTGQASSVIDTMNCMYIYTKRFKFL
jgi:hypothetical protein